MVILKCYIIIATYRSISVLIEYFYNIVTEIKWKTSKYRVTKAIFVQNDIVLLKIHITTMAISTKNIKNLS
jgi:hypothetical protein